MTTIPSNLSPQTPVSASGGQAGTAQPAARTRVRARGTGGKGRGRGGKPKPNPKQQMLNAPITPGSTITNRIANALANAAARLQYGGQQQQLAQTGQNINAWFPAYQQELQNLQNQQQQRYAATQQGILASASASQQQQSQTNQTLQQQLQADAANRGATYSGLPTAQGQQATNIGQDLANAFAAGVASQGVGYAGFTSGQQGVGAAAELGARQQLAGQRQALKGQVGAYKTNYLGQLRTNEQKNVLEQQAFGLNAQKEADQVANSKRSARTSRQNSRRSSQTSRANNAANNATSQQNAELQAAARRAAAKQRAALQAQKNKLAHDKHVQDVRTTSSGLVTQIQQVQAILRDPKAPKNAAQQLVSGANPQKKAFPQAVVNAAAILNHGGLLSPDQVKALHKLGMRVPRAWIEANPKVKPKPKPPQNVFTAPLAPPSIN